MTSGETEYMIPQIYFYYTKNNIYLETWNLFYYGSARTTVDQKFFYGRYFMKLSGVLDWVSFGPQVEVTYDFDDQLDDSITSLSIGGRISLPYGEVNSFEIFLGAETKDENRFTSRFSFIRYF